MVKRILIKWWGGFISKTPEGWNHVVKIAAFIVVAIPLLDETSFSSSAPLWYNSSKWYIGSTSLIIGLIAQSKSKKENGK